MTPRAGGGEAAGDAPGTAVMETSGGPLGLSGGISPSWPVRASGLGLGVLLVSCPRSEASLGIRRGSGLCSPVQAEHLFSTREQLHG